MSSPEPSVVAGRYQLLRELPGGTVAETSVARDLQTDELVVVKLLRAQYTRDPAVVRRFKREARLAMAVSHPNVVRVLATGRDGERPYLVMEWVDGRDLKQLIVAEAPLAINRAVAIVLDLLAGLEAIHRAGIVHRDLKPQNILIDSDGRARIGDFGIARAAADSALTSTGQALGTAAYMAPEQASGGRASAASDLYALGVVLFELVTGRLPFEGINAVQVMYQHVHTPPPNPRALQPHIPAALEAIVLRLLAKDPADRYPDAAAVRTALQAANQQPTVVIPAPATTVRVPRPATPAGEGSHRQALTRAATADVLAFPRRPGTPMPPAPDAFIEIPVTGKVTSEPHLPRRSVAPVLAVVTLCLLLLAGLALAWVSTHGDPQAPARTTSTAGVEPRPSGTSAVVLLQAPKPLPAAPTNAPFTPALGEQHFDAGARARLPRFTLIRGDVTVDGQFLADSQAGSGLIVILLRDAEVGFPDGGSSVAGAASLAQADQLAAVHRPTMACAPGVPCTRVDVLHWPDDGVQGAAVAAAPAGTAGGSCEGVAEGYLQDVTTVAATAGSFVHLQFHRWQGERTTLLPPGDYTLGADVAGYYWVLGPGCTAETAMARHVRPSIAAAASRDLLEPYYVDWTWAVEHGFVVAEALVEPLPVIPAP